jgi:acyl carrier protein
MDRDVFLQKLAEVLKADPAAMTESTVVTPEAWDSLELLSILGLIDSHLGATVSPEKLKTCRTVADIFGLAQAGRA